MRRAMIEGEVVDCMIALPGQLFYSAQIPACLWFLTKDKWNGIARITDTYHALRLGEGYADVPGFCKSASIPEIRSNGHVLTLGRYVGDEAAEEEETPFAERFAALQEQLETQFATAKELTATIRARLAGVGL